jgi:hypothetical protein
MVPVGIVIVLGCDRRRLRHGRRQLQRAHPAVGVRGHHRRRHRHAGHLVARPDAVAREARVQDGDGRRPAPRRRTTSTSSSSCTSCSCWPGARVCSRSSRTPTDPAKSDIIKKYPVTSPRTTCTARSWPRRCSTWSTASRPTTSTACSTPSSAPSSRRGPPRRPAWSRKIGDSLPGIGIVAAVLGIIVVMGHMDAPPAVIGLHVAAALVGTFLGILLCYGILVAASPPTVELQEAHHIRFLDVHQGQRARGHARRRPGHRGRVRPQDDLPRRAAERSARSTRALQGHQGS